MGCTLSTLMPINDDGSAAVCEDCFQSPNHYGLSIDLDVVHSSHSPYLGSFFFASPRNRCHTPDSNSSSESDMLTASTVSSEEEDNLFPEQDLNQRQRTGLVQNASNTLPSFRKGCPLHLKITESYKAAENNNDEHDFSYDPDLSSREFIVKSRDGTPYGGGLHAKLGAQFSLLGDQWGRVLAATWSRRTSIPSHVIYSSKPFFMGQPPTLEKSIGSHTTVRSESNLIYPWALLTKTGPTEDHVVNLHLVDEVLSKKSLNSKDNDCVKDGINHIDNIDGSYFCTEPAYQSQNIFHNGIHSQTIISKLTEAGNNPADFVPCCFILRDPLIFDIFDVTIAPGIDPLLIICCISVHARMDMEIIHEQAQWQAKKALGYKV